MAYLYPPMLAFDQDGNIVRSGEVPVYDESGTVPLAITDAAGVPISTITINANGLTEAFYADSPESMAISGEFRIPLSSARGMREAAELAASAASVSATQATQAAAAAAQAQAAAEDAAAAAALAGGGGGPGDGNLVVMPVWNGVGTQPARNYPTGHPKAGLVIPNAPAVFVRWRQPAFPIGVAQDGDEFRRTGL